MSHALQSLPTKVESSYVALQKDGRPGIRLRSFQGDKESPMSIATYENAVAARIEAVPAAKPMAKRQGLFARLYASLIEARRRKAFEELKRHGVMLPFELEQAGWKVN